MSHAPRPIGGGLITPFTLFLAVLAAIGGYFVLQRFIYGFNAAAAFNDGYTWGIWIAYDVVIGTAFGCGGYVMALLVYVFNKGQYHPLVRPALLASLLGYGLGAVSVVVDLGRYWNMWHMMWPGYAQPNSVMLEVGLCVAIYVMVLFVEFSPAFLERFGLTNLKRKVEKWMVLFIALGILLPTMHQSSLGTMMVIFGHQIHPLWQTTLLPLLFLMSAITMGFCIVIFEASLASAGFRRPGEAHILGGLSGVIIALQLVWLTTRFVDLHLAGKMDLVLGSGWLSGFFLAEIALFALPVLLLLPKANRTSPRPLFLAAVAMLLGGSLYRIDVFLVAYFPATPGFSYFPSVPEIMVTLGIVAFEFLAYIVLARTLPVLPGVEPAKVAVLQPAE
ncbi:MAG: Ni/Fe-hydrogenase cytochrome b subunit [Alphaproteobacteria bacterium]|nr:Ni/Fe-hydrogenase cytochrome b subunit [Alphaproteobacteria bacterium]